MMILMLTLNQTLTLTGLQFSLGAIVQTPYFRSIQKILEKQLSDISVKKYEKS